MRTLAVLVGIVILLTALHAAASIVVPLLLGATIAVAFQPLSDRLEKHGAPPLVSAAVTIVVVLAVVGAIGALMVIAAGNLTQSMPQYQAELVSARREITSWLVAHDMAAAATPIGHVDPAAGADQMVKQTLVSASDVLGDAFLVLLIAVFIQLEATTMKQKLRLGLGDQRVVDQTLTAIGEVQRYLIAKSFLSLLNGILLGAWCWLWGVPDPLLWGVLAFVLNFVPIIGSLIAGIPPVALALVHGGLGSAFGVAAGYGVVNLLVDYILEPRLMGRALGLSALVVLLSMLTWGFVLGPVGALLSVPLTVAVRIVLDQHEDTKWIALLLAAGPAARRERSEQIKRRSYPPTSRP